MGMFDEYFTSNGTVDRAKIAMHVKTRKLTRVEIEQLCADPRVQAGFKGTTFSDKRPKSEWNKNYLHLLSYVVVAGPFNQDYLLYLDEVAEYVSKAKFKKVVIAGVIVILVIIAGVIVYSYIL